MSDGWSRDEYPDDWDSRRKSVYARDGHQCQNCGAKGGPFGNTELHCHHKIPKSEGGSHQKSNLITLCRDCHNDVHDHYIPKMSEINSSSGGGSVTSFRARSESTGPASQNLRRIGRKYGNSEESATLTNTSSTSGSSTSSGSYRSNSGEIGYDSKYSDSDTSLPPTLDIFGLTSAISAFLFLILLLSPHIFEGEMTTIGNIMTLLLLCVSICSAFLYKRILNNHTTNGR